MRPVVLMPLVATLALPAGFTPAPPATEPLPLATPGISVPAVAPAGAVTYTFDDIGQNCAWNTTLFPNPYQDLVFPATPRWATCPFGGSIVVLPVDASVGANNVGEVLIQLPAPASDVSIQSYDVGPTHEPTLVAYDAAGAVVGSSSDGTNNTWVTLAVSAPGISRIGLRMAQAANYLDNLTVTYGPTDPTTADQCRKGGHEAFGFRTQGQCVQFVETGRDSRRR